MKVLLTGATGDLGSKTANFLLKKLDAASVAVSVRNPEKATELKAKGVDVRQGDFDQPETLKKAFSGIDKLLIISTGGDNQTRIRQHTAAVNAAKEAGVKHIVYTSVVDADHNKLDLAQVHRATEKAIKETGLAYTFLRNNWYLENETMSIKGTAQGMPWVTSAKDGKVGWALKSDYAEAAAAVLAESGHENKIYELSGPLRTQSELAAIVGKVVGRSVNVEQVSDEAYGKGLESAGMPEPVIKMFEGIQKSIREGALDVQSNDFEKVLGHPVTPMDEAVKIILEN